MGTMNHWAARAGAVVAAATLAITAVAPTSTAESVKYDLDGSPYVKTITIDNGAADVVVRYVARKTPRNVTFQGWSVEVDAVAEHRSDSGAAEFSISGMWNRDRARLYRFADDGSFEATRVRCDGLTSSRDGRVKTVTIPRACLVYTETAATAVRVSAGVYGIKVRPDGTGCWGAGAPRRGFSAWLEPGTPSRTIARVTRSTDVSARGC